MSQLAQLLQNLGLVRLSAIGVVSLSSLGLIFYLAMRIASPEMTPLISGIDPAQSGKILDRLDSMGVETQVRGDGQIYVPSDRVARIRMDLAQEGLPSSNNFGYEIFDRNDVFGTTGPLLDINLLRATEGELARSIQTLNGVAQARVHLVLPKKELFSKTQTEPSASVMVKMRDLSRLSVQQVQAIQNLLASAIPNLKTERVSVVDEKGTLLSRNRFGESFEGLNTQQEIQLSYENRLSHLLENLLSHSLGNGKVKVQVRAEMDFDRLTINKEEYDPDGQVVRSTSTVEEDNNSKETDSNVSVQNALPSQGQAGGGGGAGNSNQARKTEENVSYEISKTHKVHVKESGTIKKLSIAVLVDGTYDGQNYKARGEDELNQLKKLVKSASGFDEKRGDNLEVINMRFVQESQFGTTSEIPWWQIYNLGKILEIIVIAGLAMLIMLLVVRPMILKIIASLPEPEEAPEEATQALPGSKKTAAGSGTAMIGSATAASASGISNGLESVALGGYQAQDPEQLIDLEKVEGAIKASSVKKIAKIVEEFPNDSLEIIRNWMNNYDDD